MRFTFVMLWVGIAAAQTEHSMHQSRRNPIVFPRFGAPGESMMSEQAVDAAGSKEGIANEP
jgi:hypothetical protein